MPTLSQAVFDLFSAQEFFRSIKESYDDYKARGSMRDLMYVIMGLNHLREWIAPGYKFDHKRQRWPKAIMPEQIFSRMIYSLQDFKLLREVCNKTKHMTKKISTAVEYGPTLAEWESLASVNSLARGYPKVLC